MRKVCTPHNLYCLALLAFGLRFCIADDELAPNRPMHNYFEALLQKVLSESLSEADIPAGATLKVKQLLSNLVKGDAETRAIAIQGLSELDGGQSQIISVPFWVASLNDKGLVRVEVYTYGTNDIYVKDYAAAALAKCDDKARAMYLMVVQHGEHSALFYDCACALAKSRERASAGILAKYIMGSRGTARISAIKAVQDWQHPELKEALLTCADDSDFEVRAATARSLGCQPNTMQLLLDMTNDPSTKVRKCAILSLSHFIDNSTANKRVTATAFDDKEVSSVRAAAVFVLSSRGSHDSVRKLTELAKQSKEQSPLLISAVISGCKLRPDDKKQAAIETMELFAGSRELHPVIRWNAFHEMCNIKGEAGIGSLEQIALDCQENTSARSYAALEVVLRNQGKIENAGIVEVMDKWYAPNKIFGEYPRLKALKLVALNGVSDKAREFALMRLNELDDESLTPLETKHFFEVWMK